MSKFQLGVLITFGAFILVGTIIFAMGKSGSSGKTYHIAVWGFVTDNDFQGIMSASTLAGDKTISVTYTQKDPKTFDNDYVQALADGAAPDVFFVGSDQLYKERNRIFVIPFNSYPQRTFQDSFTRASYVFLNDKGVMAIPVSVDPIILYWNKNIFTNNAVASAPQTWAMYTSYLIDKFTQKDGALTINQSALPFGTWDNLQDAKGILSALIFQGGGYITTKNANGELVSALNFSNNNGLYPLQAALNFFVDFSNPQKNVYTWNRSLPNSLDYFAAGKSATYLGYASEIPTIQSKNPNTSFDIATIPQSDAQSDKVTYGRVMGLSISKATKDVTNSIKVLYALSSAVPSKIYNTVTNTAPALNASLSSPDNSNLFQPVVYRSAIISQTWLDPDTNKTDSIFSDMVNSIISGRSRISDAFQTGQQELSNLLQQ